MKSCWAHRPEDRPRFRSIVDVLDRLYDRFTRSREDSEFSDVYDESEEEDNSLTPAATSSRNRITAGSAK